MADHFTPLHQPFFSELKDHFRNCFRGFQERGLPGFAQIFGVGPLQKVVFSLGRRNLHSII